MPQSDPSPLEQRRLVEGWREAGRALDRQRRLELRSQSEAESRQAAFDMLQLGGMMPPESSPRRSSGMVEMQRLFARGHGRRGA